MKRLILLVLPFFVLLYSTGTANAHVTLSYKGNNAKIKRAVKRANKILQSDAFYEEIKKVKSFDFSELTGEEVAKLMRDANHTIVIKGAFKPIANASTTSSGKIKVSWIRFSKRLATGVNTLIHETVHAIDLMDNKTDFTHNGNSPKGQERTAPWVIGKIAEDMIQ